MGGCASDRNSNLKKYKIAFNDEEFLNLQKVFERLKAVDNLKGNLTQKSMIPMFKENPEFAVKLFRWMQARSQNGVVDYETFVITLELLIKDQAEYYLSDYKYRVFEKFEIFTLISTECLDTDKDIINRLVVPYSKGSIVLKELINMYYFNNEVSNSLKNDLAARSICCTVFDEKPSLQFTSFIKNTKTQLIYVNNVCKKYFQAKFLETPNLFQLPQIDQPSFILNQNILSLIMMSSPQFQKVNEIKLLYTTSVKPGDFDELSDIILKCQIPMLFIFRSREEMDFSESYQQSIFGAFINVDILLENHSMRRIERDPGCKLDVLDEEIPSYAFGDERSFLFSIVPKYQIFMSSFENTAKRSFAFLNNRNYQINKPGYYGLGFGGNGEGNFHIWIDENMNKNYIDNSCEETYETGFLLEPHINSLNLTAIEVWAIHTDESVPYLQKNRDIQSDIILNKQ